MTQKRITVSLDANQAAHFLAFKEASHQMHVPNSLVALGIMMNSLAPPPQAAPENRRKPKRKGRK